MSSSPQTGPGRRPFPLQLRPLLVLAGFVVVIALVLAQTLATSSRVPVSNALYLPFRDAGYEQSIGLAPVAAGEAPCLQLEVDAAGATPPVKVCADEVLELGGQLFRLLHEGEQLTLEHVGARLALGREGTVGAGRDADALLRLPGVGVTHVRFEPADRCGAELGCVRDLLGDDRTRLQQPGQSRPVALRRGELAPLTVGQTLWLGLSPLLVERAGGELALTLPDGYASFGGSRGWLRDAAPRWPLVGPGPWRLLSERVLYKGEHLQRKRISRQREEEVQLLVDKGLLCLEVGVPGTARPPALVWIDPAQGRCVSSADTTLLDEEALVLLERYRYDRSLIEMIGDANRSLAEGSYLAAPSTLHFAFDWSNVQLPSSLGREILTGTVEMDELAEDGEGAQGAIGLAAQDDEVLVLAVPTRLLGIWWGTTIEGIPARDVEAEEALRDPRTANSPIADITVRKGTTSSQLRVTRGAAGLIEGDLLLLQRTGGVTVPLAEGGAEGVSGSLTLMGEVCMSAGRLGRGYAANVFRRSALSAPLSGGEDQNFYGSALPLGRLTLSTADPSRVRLEAISSASEGECLRVASDTDGRVFWNPGSLGWTAVQSGETLTWRSIEFVYRDTGDYAAVNQAGSDSRERLRVYPFEDDAGQLIGKGDRHYTGLEASLTDDVLTQAEGAEIELTIHGDLQRVLHRALARVMEANVAEDRSGAARDLVRGSAVLLDGDSGAVLAAATWPPYDPNRDIKEDRHQLAAGQLAGRTFDPAENLAFNRNRAAGSTYKVATSVAMSKAGLLSDGQDTTRGVGCSAGSKIYSWRGQQLQPREAAARDGKSDPAHFRCTGNHAVVPSRINAGRATFVEAFAHSCNVYFGMAGLAMMGGVVPFGGIEARQLHLKERDLGLGTGSLVFTDGGANVGLVFGKDVPLGASLVPRDSVQGTGANQFLSTLMEYGHRFYYTSVGGLVHQQSNDEWAPGHSYPTARVPWMPGLQVGHGFRYPEVPGPATFADDAWPSGIAPDERWQGGKMAHLSTSRPLRTLALLPWGQDVQSSALSLAVIAATPASTDGSIVAPWILRVGEQERRLVTERALPASDLELLRRAMRQVVGWDTAAGAATGSGTGVSYFNHLGARADRIRSMTGGKTGTITVQLPPGSSNTAALQQIRRVRYYACGLPMLPPGSADLLPPALRGDDWAPYASKVGSLPPPGFASGTESCQALTPGRVVAATAESYQTQAEAWEAVYRRRRPQGGGELAESSSFVAAVFDDLVSPPSAQAPAPASAPAPVEPDRALRAGRGLALAVVADYHPKAAKLAAAAILNDIDVYYQVRGGALPTNRAAPQE